MTRFQAAQQKAAANAAFYGTYGSPIQTPMDHHVKQGKFTAPDATTKGHTSSDISTDGTSSSSDSNDDEMEITQKQGVRKCALNRKVVGAAAAAAATKWEGRSFYSRAGAHLPLEVARNSNIPLFSHSPFFQDNKPSAAAAAAALDVKILPARQANNQNINFNEIELGKSIGEGAFGRVHEGKWRGRAVAVKILISQDLSEDILTEFESEVQIMRVMRHPNICRLLGACIDPPNRALVVELASRGALWDVLRRNKSSIDGRMRFNFVNDAAKGMSYLHNFQPPILHRDLKSPNLLVDNDYTIKISDFGLARVKARVQTMTGNCGTVQWMAPEVLGNQKYTEKADVFSFGIVVWEIVTGELPYSGMSQIQAGLGVLNRNLRPIIPRSCPPFLAQLMKACWARQPELRPSFLQIVRALKDYSIRMEAEHA